MDNMLARILIAVALAAGLQPVRAEILLVDFDTRIERRQVWEGVDSYRYTVASGRFRFDDSTRTFLDVPLVHLENHVFWFGEDVTALHEQIDGLPARPTDWTVDLSATTIGWIDGRPVFRLAAFDADDENRIFKPAASPTSPPRALDQLFIGVGGSDARSDWLYDNGMPNLGVPVAWSIRPVPEPSAATLLAAGLAVLAWSLVRRPRLR